MAAGILLLFFFLQFRASWATCGGYITASASSSGQLVSPGFPAPYNIAEQCIWIFDAPQTYGVQFNFTTLSLELSSTGGCEDYVEIREGSASKSLVFRGCNQTSVTVVQTSTAYAWVKYFSNYMTVNQGFNVTWSIFHTGNTSAELKRTCHISQFQCGNKECIHRGALCDNFNDCGCSSWDCDESDYFCKKPALSLWALYTIACGIGFLLFLTLFLLFGFLESRSHYRRVPESEKKAASQGQGGCCSCCARGETKEQRAAREEEEKLELAYQQMIEIMMDGKRVVNWDSDNASPKTSAVPSRQPSITEASLPARPKPPVSKFGSTLSPKDVPRVVKT